MWRKLVSVAAACIPAIGCASGGTTTREPSPASTPAVAAGPQQSNVFGAAASDYTLVSVDGHQLPYVPPTGEDEIAPAQVVRGTLTLQPNGEFSMSTTRRDTQSAGQRSFDAKSSGSCAPDGNAYRMYWDGGGDTELSISGDTVTVDNDGMHFRYVKRG